MKNIRNSNQNNLNMMKMESDLTSITKFSSKNAVKHRAVGKLPSESAEKLHFQRHNFYVPKPAF